MDKEGIFYASWRLFGEERKDRLVLRGGGGAVPQVEPPEKAQKQVLERKCWEDKTKFCLVLFFFAVMRSVIHYTEV